MSQNSPSRVAGADTGAGCLVVFGLPFMAVGLVAASGVLRHHQSDWLALLTFGGIFFLVGLTIVILGVALMRISRQSNALRQIHPDQPWLWEPQWAQGRIYDNSKAALWVLWLFTFFWNAISATATLMAFRNAHGSRPAVYVVLLFPAVGAGLLIAAIHLALRRVRFGRSILNLETQPGCIGGWLAGVIQTPSALTGTDHVQLTLRNIRKTTTDLGDHQSTQETVLWEDEQILSPDLPLARFGGSLIPVSFRIPCTCERTDQSNRRNHIFWRLRAHAPMVGPDYLAEFIVPVFVTQQAASAVPSAESQAQKLRLPRPAQARRGDDSRIVFSPGPGTHKRFLFPAARNIGAALTLTSFALIFAGIGIAIQVFAHETVMGIPFEAIGLAVAWGASLMWFREVELQFDPHQVQRYWRMLGLSGTRIISANEIAAITHHSNSSVNDTAYYTVRANRKRGGSASLISGLRCRDAEWVNDEICESLGLSAPSAGSPVQAGASL